jgi:Zn ribbon nucleic-acid-binding protein
MTHFESAGNVVPMLCPSCCTLDEIPDWPESDADELAPVVGCRRCGFSFPNLPGEFKGLTLHAIHNHRCEGADHGNWAGVGDAILKAMGGQGEYPELPSWPHADDARADARQAP